MRGERGEIQRSSAEVTGRGTLCSYNKREGRGRELMFRQVDRYSRSEMRTFLPDYFCFLHLHEKGSSARVEGQGGKKGKGGDLKRSDNWVQSH